MPEFIDPVFAITNPKRSFSVFVNERFGLVFAKAGSINWAQDIGRYISLVLLGNDWRGAVTRVEGVG